MTKLNKSKRERFSKLISDILSGISLLAAKASPLSSYKIVPASHYRTRSFGLGKWIIVIRNHLNSGEFTYVMVGIRVNEKWPGRSIFLWTDGGKKVSIDKVSCLDEFLPTLQAALILDVISRV